MAEDTFFSKEKANIRLRQPISELNGETPLGIAQTEAGARVIAHALPYALSDRLRYDSPHLKSLT